MSTLQQKASRNISPPMTTGNLVNMNMSGSGLGSPPSQTSIPMGLQNQNQNASRTNLGDNASVSSLNMSQLAALPGSKML